jgi:hypothetical protein
MADIVRPADDGQCFASISPGNRLRLDLVGHRGLHRSIRPVLRPQPLAVFSLALLRLQIEADGGNADAAKMALGRQDKAIAGTNSGANVIRLAGFLVMTI